MPCSPKNDPLFACLVLERGAPYEKGACFLLRQSKLTLGRSTSSCTPDITFDSLLISRKHCCIEQRGEGWSICELKSKHGTLLNGEPLPQSLSVPLKHGDKIGLAANIVSLRFSLTPELDQTLDYNCADPLPGATVPQPAVPVVIDTAKKSLLVGGAEVTLSAKEWLLLELVYKHRNELVTYDSIRMTVWAERVSSAGRPPEVGVEEINLLLYRLRRKLGAGANILKTRRGRGCLLKIG